MCHVLLGVTTGPDGNLRFTNNGGNPVGRITLDGAITIFAAPGMQHPEGIASCPDGNLWFANSSGGSIGSITPDGQVTIHKAAGIQSPDGIALGADGHLCFANAEGKSLGRITTDGAVTIFADATGTFEQWNAGIATADDGTFGSHLAVTRTAMAAFLDRAAP